MIIKLLFMLTAWIQACQANLWCYNCISTQPGCEEFYVDWRIHSAITCPKADDKCVKIIERKGDDTRITRDCLSNLAGYRTDIPADTYEGCRPAAKPKVAIYVENEIAELDLKRDYWDKINYCFCEFDEWCNSARSVSTNVFTVIGCVMMWKLSQWWSERRL